MTKDNKSENNLKLLYFEFSKMKYLIDGKSVEIEGTYPVYVSAAVIPDLSEAIDQFTAYKCKLGLRFANSESEEEGILTWSCQGGKASAHVEAHAVDAEVVRQLEESFSKLAEPKKQVAFLNEHGLLSEVF